MEPTLDFFLKRVDKGWWVNGDTDLLRRCIQETYAYICNVQSQQSNGSSQLKVLITEADRTRFIGFFLGAVAAGALPLLANASWKEKEWKDVAAVLKPDLILGSNAESLYSKYLWQNGYPVKHNLQHPILIPSGGSSGKVHFAWHTWDNFFRSTEGLRKFLKCEPIHSINILEFYHIAGIMPIIRSLVTGGKYMDARWKDIEEGNLPSIDNTVWNLSIVPTQLERCIQNPTTVEWLKSLNVIFIGGATLRPELIEQSRALHLPVVAVYGMTETSAMICAWPKNDFLQSTDNENLGIALPHATFIRESNNSNQKNKPSWEHIVIRAESLFYGYYPETPQKKDTFETSDEGIFSPDGNLLKIRRRDGVIISGGKKIAPGEIEDLINSEQLVKDICIFGIPSQQWGEEVVAAYVPFRNCNHAEKNMKQFLKENVAAYKVPKHWLCLERLPRNSQHKVDRAALRALFLAHPRHPS